MLSGGKPPFPYQAYSLRLQAAVKGSSAVSLISSSLPNPSGSPASATFDGQDCSSQVAELAVAACASGISQANDRWGFSKSANNDSATLAMQQAVAGLIPYMFAEDINKLSPAHHPLEIAVVNIYTLRQSPQFHYSEQPQHVVFIESVIWTDSTNSNNNYAMTLLFVHQFFSTHGSYNMVSLDPRKPATNMSLIAAKTLFTAGLEGQVAPLLDSLPWIATSMSTVISGFSQPFTTALDYVDALGPLLDQGAIEAVIDQIKAETKALHSLDRVDPGAIQDYVAMLPMMISEWSSVGEQYTDAMQSEMDLTNVTTEHVMPGGIYFKTEAYDVQTNTSYGDLLASWITQQRNQGPPCFSSGPPSDFQRTSVSVTGPGSSSNGGESSCFTPGTMVYTLTGNKPIECIRENDRILTNAQEHTYGVASDEVVVTSTSTGGHGSPPTRIFGFNKEAPFFTAGHVFHTTTGLRAVDPVQARKENPWLNVGRLQVGHYVLRATRLGESYQPVLVRSLFFEPAKCDTVHGVHLREGLRNYHANGYLVRVNYPEITISSVAKDLLKLPPKQRLGILRSFREITPILNRFGGQAVIDALHREASGLPKATVTRPGSEPQLPLEHMSRRWNLKQVSATGGPVKDSKSHPGQLPTLSLIDGLVHVNGKYCPRSSVDDNKTISWSRKVRSLGLWEHGACTIRRDRVSGHGILFTSKEAAPSKLPRRDNRTFFTAAMPRAQSNANGIHPRLKPAGTGFQPAPDAAAAADDTDTDPGTTATTTDDDDDDIPETFSLAYGPTGNSNPSTPLFNVVLSTTSGGLQLPDAQVSTLDSITQLLQNKLEAAVPTAASGPQGRLYQVSSWTDSQGTAWTEIDVMWPEMFYSASDDAKAATATGSYQNMTFNDLGYAGTLSMLFKKMRFAMNWNGSALNGTVTAYDPEGQGLEGTVYSLAGKFVSAGLAASATRISAVQNALRSFPARSPAPSLLRAEPQRNGHHAIASAPAAVLRNFAETDSGLSAQNLADLSINNAVLTSTSQSLLHQCMLYHMNEDDRDTFGLPAKPEVIDPQLGDDLSSDVKDWLVNTYARAFICQRINGSNDKNKQQWRRNFTSDEVKRMNYWWTGRGPKCLSRAPQYAALNQVCASVALVQIAPAILPYLNDTVPDSNGNTGGVKWSNALFQTVSGESSLIMLHKNHALLTKYCNILHTLDSSNVNANALATAAVNLVVHNTQKQQRNDVDDTEVTKKKEFDWLYDTMHAIVLGVLNGNSFMDGDIGNRISDDVNGLVNALGVDKTWSAEAKAQATLEGSLNVITSMANIIRTIRISTDLKVWAQMKGFAKITAASQTAASLAEKPGMQTFFKSVLLVAGIMSFVIQAVGAYRNWSNLSSTERATLILQRIQATANSLNEVVDIAKTLFGKPGAPPSGGPDPPELTETEKIAAIRTEQAADSIDTSISAGLLVSQPKDQNSLDSATLENEPLLGKTNPTNNPIQSPEGGSDDIELPKASKSWNITDDTIRGFVVLIGVAITIVMIIQLARNWEDLTTAIKVLTILQIVQQGLALIVDAASIAMDVLINIVETGVQIAAVLATCLAWAGGVLAVAGVVIMIALAIYEAEQPPPLTPLETWIQNTGSPFLDTLPMPPTPQLVYTVPSQISSGATFDVTVANATASDVTVSYVEVTFQGGSDPSTLFTEAKFTAVKPGGTFGAGNVQLGPSATKYRLGVSAGESQKNAQDQEITTWQVAVWTAESDSGGRKLVVPANSSFVIEISGTESATSSATNVTTDEVELSQDNSGASYQVTKV